MGTNKLTIGAVSALIVAAVTIPIAWQHNANTRLRQELQRLREEHVQMDLLSKDNQRLQRENQRLASMKLDHDEMERLRRQNQELLRLRGRVGVAKAAQAENARQLQEAQSQLNESWRRAEKWGETNVIADVEAAALQHLSMATKTEVLRKILQALMEVAQTNHTGWQLDANQLTPEGEARLKALESAFDFDVVYKGPLNQLQDPGRTIVIRQRQPEQRTDGSYTRIYGFGDGHVEIHKTSYGNFEDWERERMVPGSR
jgi:hypothetical protein